MDFKIDFHLHTRYSSDATMSIGKLFDTARSKGLNGIAVADHNVFDGAYEALSKERSGLMVIPAVEVSTELGHILCYFVTRGPAEAGLKRSGGMYRFEEVLRYVRAEKGLVFAAHPYRGTAIKVAGVLDLIDGVEIFNGRNTSRNQISNNLAKELVLDNNLSFVAGSDGHTAAEVGRVYRIFNYNKSPSKEDVRRSMLEKTGAYYGSYSPLSSQGLSAIGHSVKYKKGKRLVKDIAKILAGAVYDPLNTIRRDTKEIMGGKRYEIT